MRITVAYMRTVLKQFDKEEISFSKMVELLNEEFQEDGSFKLPDVIRVEVIDQKGRNYVNWKSTNKVELSIQDGKRTLKIFIKDETD